MAERGITGFGCHIPRRRLDRQIIADAHSWALPGLKALARGRRSFCGHDEDVITMAVAAARMTLAAAHQPEVDTLLLASTTLPFADRSNATLVGEAVGLPEDIYTVDVCGTQRAGTSALLQALRAARESTSVVVAAEQRFSKPGSVQELIFGDGAAAVAVGNKDVLARLLGCHTVSRDLVDHYRSAGSKVDYTLEERWVRDEGYLQIVPDAVQRLCEKTAVQPSDVSYFVMPVVASRTAQAIARKCGMGEGSIVDNLQGECGDTGTAHALLMLIAALEEAVPGDKVLLVGFGQGCDAMLFEVTPNIATASARDCLRRELRRGASDDSYMRFLSHAGAIDMDWGIRAERDTRTAMSALYRNRKTFTSFIGGRCAACNTAQFPKTEICVNPHCNRRGTQVDESFRDKIGHIKSFTEDWLGHSVSPPFIYGAIRFDDNASLMMELADFDPGQVNVGDAVGMSFRIKDRDALRNNQRYFWKAVPMDV